MTRSCALACTGSGEQHHARSLLTHRRRSQTISGAPTLGGTLRVSGASGLPYATFQWLRVHKSGLQDPIGGAGGAGRGR